MPSTGSTQTESDDISDEFRADVANATEPC